MTVNKEFGIMTRYKRSILYLLLLLLPLGLHSQGRVRINDEIAEKFRRYCSQMPREEVYLETDRQDYIAGETVWFSASLFDRGSSSISSSSNTVYVELINPVNLPVVQRKVRLERGIGPGMFILPDTLSSGTYLLRAYTNWMKNFLPANCFMKEVRIYNSLSSRSYPGKPGIGAQSAENTSSASLETGNGLKVNIIPSGSDTVNVVIETDEGFRLGSGSSFYLFIQTHGVINMNESVRLTGSTTVIPVPVSTLLPGINQVMLFNSVGEPVSEKYIYTPDKKPFTLSVNAPDAAGKREKVVLNIDPAGNKDLSLGISVSATGGEDFQGVGDYMVFGTEFGTLPDALRGKKLSSVPAEAVNSFLAHAKSNWIDWKMILADRLPDISYSREKQYHNLAGILIDKKTMAPDSGRVVYLSRPGKEAYLQYSKTDNNGKFSFLLPESLSGRDLVIQPADPSRNDIIKLESAFSSAYFPSESAAKSPVAAGIPGFADKWSVNYQVGRIYNTISSGEALKQDIMAADPLRFYGKPDNILIMDNYIKLPVMQEVFFELVPGVSLKSHKSDWEITVIDPVDLTPYTIPPLLMIDGVVVRDASTIAGIDPDLVERIETLRERYMIGDLIFYGIVNIITRAGNFSCVPLPDYAVRIPWRISDAVQSFTSPDYSAGTSGKHIPDFRNTLYWNPSLKPGNDGKYHVEFWSSDFSSDYDIVIEGVSDNDRLITIEKTLSIR